MESEPLLPPVTALPHQAGRTNKKRRGEKKASHSDEQNFLINFARDEHFETETLLQVVEKSITLSEYY